MFFDDLIIPSSSGGTKGFTAIDSGYLGAAKELVEDYDAGYRVDTSDYGVNRVLEKYGASDMNELKTKIRGW